eukprot:1877360-Rhodomonas_salina.1
MIPIEHDDFLAADESVVLAHSAVLLKMRRSSSVSSANSNSQVCRSASDAVSQRALSFCSSECSSASFRKSAHALAVCWRFRWQIAHVGNLCRCSAPFASCYTRLITWQKPDSSASEMRQEEDYLPFTYSTRSAQRRGV